METLKNFEPGVHAFRILSLTGFWKPRSLKSSWVIRLYSFYSIVMLLYKLSFDITFFLGLYHNRHKLDIFIESFFLVTTTFLITFKVIYLNIHKQDVHTLINLFSRKQYLPCNNEEIVIYKIFQYNERIITRIFVTSTFLTVSVYMFWPLTYKEIGLPFKRWTPYSVNSKEIFWMTYAFDCTAGYLTIFLYSSMESLLAIFMQLICVQLNIFIKRLLQITNLKNNVNEKVTIYQQECNLVRECVDHHVCIFLMEKKLNDIFGLLVFSQFFVSIVNLCFSGFYLTILNPSGVDLLMQVMIILCYTFQIFITCLFGEEMTRKSLSISNEIYKMDWTLLSVQTKQKLIIIMMRAARPIQLSGGSVVVLSIETFCKVFKASYSFFNLLRRSD